MKKAIFLLLVICVYFKSSAQSKLTPWHIKGLNQTFDVKKFKMLPTDTQSFISVYSSNNKYINGIPYSGNPHLLPIGKNDIHVDTSAIKRIIAGALVTKTKDLKNNREKMDIILYFNKDGKIIDAYFFLKANTIINAGEMEEIDKRFKENIRATFTGKAYLQYDVINYNTAPSIVF